LGVGGELVDAMFWEMGDPSVDFELRAENEDFGIVLVCW
jgi:hypothetical protein